MRKRSDFRTHALKNLNKMDKHNLEYNLTVSAMGGDADAFCELYELYKHRLYRYARYRLGNDQDAEDAVSECFLSAWNQLGSLRDPGAFAGWMFTILSGQCGRIISDQIRRRELLSQEDAKATDAKATNTKATDAKSTNPVDTQLILQEALDMLSEEDRSIVLLSIIGGFKSREIASITGIKPGSVRSRLSRALAKMRAALE